MKKNFYLIRHGEKVKKIGDPPLSEKGKQQAKLTGIYFKPIPVTKILSSPIKRCKETAKVIADQLDLNYEINDLLKERVNWGDDPKQSFDDFIAMWKKASLNREWQPLLGDSSVNAGKRMEKVIQDFLPSDDKHILLVTHGGIICDYLRNVFSNNILKKFTNDDLVFDDAIKVCSVTTVEVNTSNSKSKLIKFAGTSHL